MMLLLRPVLSETAAPAENAPCRGPLGGLARWTRRRGATMVEYLVFLSVIVAVLILAIQHVGSVTSGLYKKSATTMPAGGSGS